VIAVRRVRGLAAGVAAACLWATPSVALQAQAGAPPGAPSGAAPGAVREDAALRRARALLREVGLVDTHNDLPWVLRLDAAHPMDLAARDLRRRGGGDTDLPRLREGGVGTQFWSVYVPSDLAPFEAMRAQLEQIDLARRLIARYPRDLGFATSTADIRRVRASGRIASLLGAEGGHTIGNSLGALRAYYDLGVRYMTLTHFANTDWADAATAIPRHGGLSPFGREVVREMNRLGMMVDISHVSPAAMSAVLDVTEAPVIFSHSSARALTDHVRNVPDSILRRMARNGGVVQVNFVTVFVSEPLRRWSEGLIPRLQRATSDSAAERLVREWTATHGPMPRATLTDLADHIDHIRRVAGADHVGIGADFYGATGPMNVVEGMEDVSKYPALFAELIRRGWSDADLRKLAGGNLMRVFVEVERVAARLRRTREPSTATIEALDGGARPAPPPGSP
jgi:membrane dipeptidase